MLAVSFAPYSTVEESAGEESAEEESAGESLLLSAIVRITLPEGNGT